MTVSISVKKSSAKKCDVAIITYFKAADDGKPEPTKDAVKLDKDTSGYLEAMLERHDDFSGKADEILSISAPQDSPFKHIVCVGLGDAEKLDILVAQKIGRALHAELAKHKTQSTALHMSKDGQFREEKAGAVAAYIASGVYEASYSFDKYKTADDDKPKKKLEEFTIVTNDDAKASNALKLQLAVLDGVDFARDLINEPPNKLYPESYAQILKEQLKPLGVGVEILDEKKLTKLGMEAHVSVGMGSDFPPCAVVLKWNGATGKSKDEAPLAFVGKGVTFDSGGINIKPSAGMEAMKIDMGGAAAVSGLIKTLALRKAKVNVIGIVGLAENMPSARAYRPSDVIGSMAGKTIEVLNTDAEGRLVLADCMTYVQRKHKPKMMIDLATLTGAMLVALGHEFCGTFVNNDDLWTKLEAASKSSGEQLWRMPLGEAFTKEMRGTISDYKNLGNSRNAGASTAAAFLEFFVENNLPWAHMDIAGMTMGGSPKGPRVSFGVKVLNQLVHEFYESKK